MSELSHGHHGKHDKKHDEPTVAVYAIVGHSVGHGSETAASIGHVASVEVLEAIKVKDGDAAA